MKTFKEFIAESEGMLDRGVTKSPATRAAERRAAMSAKRAQLAHAERVAKRAVEKTAAKEAANKAATKLHMDMESSWGSTYPDVEPYEHLRRMPEYAALHRSGELQAHMNRAARSGGYKDADHMFSSLAKSVGR